MTSIYDEDDRLNAPPNHMPLIGADIEINANVSGDDVVVRVNKGGVQVCRVLLQNAAEALTSDQLSISPRCRRISCSRSATRPTASHV